MKTLTIGIPTYKRPLIVLSIIKNLIENKATDYVDILLIDDGPSPELKEMLEPYNNDIKFIQHQENIGYARTFCELLEECETAYIMLTADDDEILLDGIKQTIDILNSEAPDFLSTWIKHGKTKITRGRNSYQEINLMEVGAASTHAPGLVYKVKTAMPHLWFLKNRLQLQCSATFFYPQVILLYILVSKNFKCFWHPVAPIVEGMAMETNLKDSSGKTYQDVAGRWHVYIDYINLFKELENYDLTERNKECVIAWRNLYTLRAYERINFAIKVKHPELMSIWIGGSIAQHIGGIRSLLKTISHYMKFRKLRSQYRKTLND